MPSSVYYAIPADGDDIEHPNVFSVPMSHDKMRLSHLQENFPLHGLYHFRAKYKWKVTYGPSLSFHYLLLKNNFLEDS